MNLLLDTHVLLWWLGNDPKLTSRVRESVENPERQVFVSAATAWEISIKSALGKLTAPRDLPEKLEFNRFHELPVKVCHATVAGQLPNHHRDPFDRMLVSQAQCENLVIVTRDENIRRYDVKCLWA